MGHDRAVVGGKTSSFKRVKDRGQGSISNGMDLHPKPAVARLPHLHCPDVFYIAQKSARMDGIYIQQTPGRGGRAHEDRDKVQERNLKNNRNETHA